MTYKGFSIGGFSMGEWIFILIVLAIFIYLISKHYYRIHIIFNYELLGERTPDSFDIANPGEYKKKIDVGWIVMAKSKIVVCGMLRDASPNFKYIQRRIMRLVKYFKDYRVLIVENDSKDNTRELLNIWAKENPRVIVLGCGVNAEKCTLQLPKTQGHNIDASRIKKMAYLRNLYLDFIRKNFSIFDYAVVWDLDILGSVYIDGVANSFGFLGADIDQNIPAICANGIYRIGPLSLYYDTYAHRDIDDDFHLSEKGIFDIRKRLFEVKYTRGEPLVNVKSCFSGFAIYRIPSLIRSGARYGTRVTEDGHIECEHVILHNSLRSMYLNPSMIYLVLLNK